MDKLLEDPEVVAKMKQARSSEVFWFSHVEGGVVNCIKIECFDFDSFAFELIVNYRGQVTEIDVCGAFFGLLEEQSMPLLLEYDTQLFATSMS